MSADTLTAPRPTSPTPSGEPATRRRRPRWVLVLLFVVAVAAALGVRAVVATAGDVRDGTESVSAQEFGARTGIDVTLLGVTAGGGMIEFRYQVVDPDKASLVLHDDSKRPVLVAEDTGKTLAMVSRPHSHKAELKLGGTYFFLMANTGNALLDGTKVTIVIGDVRLEHVTARS
jgi:hypothetical protein